MRLIVCVDDKLGMLFNQRRQSKDSVLRTDMLALTQYGTLWMNPYSAAQFEDKDLFCTDEEFLEKAEKDDYCFVENTDISPYAQKVTGVIVYRWNRQYPADRKFPIELFKDRWTLKNVVEFAGASHEVITREEYVL